jgi:hypothetical protein
MRLIDLLKDRLNIINDIEVIKDWDDDLIMCPSQCWFTGSYNNVEFQIYLRWRWDDPWQARVKIKNVETRLNISFYEHDDLKLCKTEALLLTALLIQTTIL